MVNHFLTVEDVNGVLLTYDNVNSLFCVGMADMTGYDWFRCDFVECSKTSSTVWNFKVSNSLWTGGFTIINSNDEIIALSSNDYSYDSTTETLTITYTGDWEDLTILFYLSSFYADFTVDYLTVVFDMKPVHFNKDNQFNVLYHSTTIPSTFNLIINDTLIDSFDYNDGLTVEFLTDYDGEYIIESSNSNTRFYGYVKSLPRLYNVTTEDSSVYLNNHNTLNFAINQDSNTESSVNVRAYYQNNLIYTDTVTVDDTVEFSFDLDLSTDNTVGVKRIHIELEDDIVQEFSFSLDGIVKPITSQAEFRSALASQIPVLYIGQNVPITGTDITINYPVEIRGLNSGVFVNMNAHCFIVNNDITFENIELRGANTLIKQINNDANIRLTNCLVRNCTNNENTASVIEQNTIDLSKFATVELTDCTFRNNQIPLVQHQNNLIINNCTFESPNLDGDTVSRSLPSFIHQKANEISISNSTFDIALDTDEYITNQIDLGVNQCNFLFGDDVIFNGANVDGIDWNTSFFMRNNTSNIVAKYYYKQANANVIVEADTGKTGNCFCYSLTGTDYVFKVNATIRRLD